MQSDDRLSTLFSQGVDPAFDELVRRYRAPLTAFAGGIVGRDRAEDVVQDSLVKAHRALATGEIREPKAWLYRVVRNTALNEIRDGSKHDHVELDDRAPSLAGDNAAEEAERREQLAMLISALAELPEAQRTALVGRELGGYTHDELAAKLGVSQGATKQLIFRARTGLRNAMGALLPAPLIVWLASDTAGTFVASGTGTAAAAGAAGVAAGTTGAAGGGAAAGGGLFVGLAGGAAAKVAVVAAVTGGTVAAGVAIEERRDPDSAARPAVVRSVESPNPVAITGSLIASTDRNPERASGGELGPEEGLGRPGARDEEAPGDAAAPEGRSVTGPSRPGSAPSPGSAPTGAGPKTGPPGAKGERPSPAGPAQRPEAGRPGGSSSAPNVPASPGSPSRPAAPVQAGPGKGGPQSRPPGPVSSTDPQTAPPGVGSGGPVSPAARPVRPGSPKPGGRTSPNPAGPGSGRTP